MVCHRWRQRRVKTSRIRILHVVHSLDPGGMENGLINVARALNPDEFEVHVCCLERRGRFAERLPYPENVSVLGKTAGFSITATNRLIRKVLRIKPALLHSHNLGPLIYSSLATGFGLFCPILHGEHSELTEDERKPKRLRQRHLLYRCCRKIHTVSNSLRRQLIDFGFPASKITVIANGVDTGRFAPGERVAARRKIGLPTDALVIGIVGRFGPYKRHSMLIESFTLLAREFQKSHLLIVGSGGPEEIRVRQQAEGSEAADRIRMTGFQANPSACYQSMDMLVIPSINEGLSNAMLEAMACGVPVLANRACGSTEVVDDGINGYIADLDSVEKLREYLRLALSNPLHLADLGASARRKMTTSFSIDHMVAGYEQIYRKIANKFH